MKNFTKILAFICLIVASMSCEKDSYIPDEEEPIVITPDVTDNEIVFTVGSVNTKAGAGTRTKAGAPKEVEVVSPTGHRMRVSDMTIEPQQTKGALVTTSTLTDFHAFGFSTGEELFGETSTPNIFHSELVDVPDGFETPHYWRKGNNSFFAYAPYPSETNGVTYSGTDASTGAPVIEFTVHSQNDETKGDQYGLTVAALVDEQNPAPGETKTVKLNFKHKQARMGFEIINAHTVWLYDISISGIYTTGSTDINPTSQWSNLNGKENETKVGISGGLETADTNGSMLRERLMSQTGAILLIPQKLTSTAMVKMTVGTHYDRRLLEFPLIDFLEEIKAGKDYTLIFDLGYKTPPFVDSYNPANCFLVRPGSAVEFYTHIIGKTTYDYFKPWAEGHKIVGIVGWFYSGGKSWTHYRIPAGKSVKVNWQTAHGRAEIGDSPEMLVKPDGITYNYDTGKCTVKVTTPTTANKGGSAFISAYSGEDGTGDILWSWHIWVTEDEVGTFDSGFTPINNWEMTMQMQDRALGAISKNPEDKGGTFGMLYQWGRMNPFTPSIYSDNIEIQIYDKNGTPINKGTKGIGGKFTAESGQAEHPYWLIQNPTVLRMSGNETLISGVEAHGGQPVDYWNRNTPRRLMYDPCPHGYFIPPLDTYENFDGSYNSTKHGWELRGSFFPLTGFRSGDGTLNNVGMSCSVWLGTRGWGDFKKQGVVLDLTPGSTNTGKSITDPHSYGNTVRCVKSHPDHL